MSTLMRHAFLFVGLAGCTALYHDEWNKKQCEVDADCVAKGVAGLVCVDNVCEAPACQPACASGYECLAAVCRPAGTKTCAADSDCASGERCGFDSYCYSKWGCLDAPDDFSAPSAPYHVKTQLQRIDIPGSTDPANIGDVDVKVCVAEDPLCTAPSLVAAEQIGLSASKQLDITFPAAKFNGMVKISPKAADAYLPSFLHVTSASPFVGDQITQRATPLSSAVALQLLPQIVQISVDPNKALLGTFLYDCGGRSAPGVSVKELNPSATSKFFVVGASNVPVQNATATTEEGAGFLVDLTPSVLTTIQLIEQPSMKVLTTFSLVPQANGFNFVNFYPRNSALKAWLTYDAKQQATPAK